LAGNAAYKPNYRGRGLGKSIVKKIQGLSVAKSKLLKLCIIKANPVRAFYEKLGFRVYEEDMVFYRMIWLDS
jgi:predicted GNAT family acetyltransferase